MFRSVDELVKSVHTRHSRSGGNPEHIEMTGFIFLVERQIRSEYDYFK